MNISLSRFSKGTGVAKTTVYRRCQELGIDTSAGLDEDAIALLCHDLDVQLVDSTDGYEPDTCNPTPDTPSVTVDVGNHQIVLAPPTMPQAFSLESLRTSEAVSFDDPLAVANRALAIADQIQTAMDADLKARQQRLQVTQQANDELQKRIQTMRLNQLKYEIQAGNLDTATTDRTMSLQDSLAELAKLGKPEQTAVHGG